MNRKKLLLVFVGTVALALRLPAPILEESPTPRTEQPAAAKPKHKNTSESSEGSKKGQASPTPKTDRSTNCSQFDGTWTGTLNCGVFGVVQFTEVISGSGTVVQSSASSRGTMTWPMTCNGKTIICNWTIGSNSGTTTCTLNADGKTMVVHDKANGGLLGSGAYDATGIFRKISS